MSAVAPTQSDSRLALLAAAREVFKKENPPKIFVPGETYIPVTAKVVDENDLSLLIDASLDMWLTAGRYAREFEAEFGKYFGRVTRSLLVNSGSSANLVAISALGSPEMEKFEGKKALVEGDEVITTPMTFAASATRMLSAL